MFIHIGGDTLVGAENIIGVFHAGLMGKGRNLPLINRAREASELDYVDDSEAKSFVLTDHKVYVSSVSTFTLKRRSVTKDGKENGSEKKHPF